MPLISNILFLRIFFSLKFPLYIYLRARILVTNWIDIIMTHFNTTEIAYKLTLFKLLIQMFHLLTHLFYNCACSFFYFFFYHILLSLKVSYQFPNNLIFKIVYLTGSKCFFNKISIAFHLSRNLVKIQLWSYFIWPTCNIFDWFIHLFGFL